MTAIECLANLIAPKNDEIEINQENDFFLFFLENSFTNNALAVWINRY